MANHKGIIGFDLDGVLYPWHREVWDYLSIAKPELTRGLDCFEFWSQIETKEIHFSAMFWENLVGMEDLYSTAIPKQDELDVLNHLAEDYDFWYITHRPKSCQFVTINYLNKYNYPYSKNLIFASGSKRKYVESVACDYFVEDRAENIEDLEGSTITILLRQPHNQKLWGKSKRQIDSILDLPYFIEDWERGNEHY